MAEGTILPGRPAWLGFLPDFLFRDSEDKVPYVLKAWLTALLPSIALAMLVGSVAPASESPDIAVNGPLMLFMLVVFAPVVETLIMTPPLLLLNRYLGPGPAVVASSAGWGVLHSLSAPTWGLVAWWPFLIFSIALLAWRSRSIVTAMLVVMSIHALQNGTVALTMLVALDPAPVAEPAPYPH